MARTTKKPQRPPGTKARPPHPGEAERVAERRAKAWKLRVEERQSYRAIAAKLGVDASTICRDLAADRAELLALRTEAAEDERAMALEELDLLWNSIRAKVKKGHLGAVREAVRIIERRSRLLGLDAPTKLAGPTGGALEVVQLYLPDNGRKRMDGGGQ